MTVSRKKILLLAIPVVLALAAGGLAFAHHRANQMAREKIETFLNESGLAAYLVYDDIEATLTGKVSILNLRSILPEASGIQLRRLVFSDITMSSDDILTHARVELQGLDVNLRELSAVGGQGIPAPVLGYGYDHLVTDLAVDVGLDEQKSRFSVEIEGKTAHVGSGQIKVVIGNINQPALRNVRDGILSSKNAAVAIGRSVPLIQQQTLVHFSSSLSLAGLAQGDKDVPDTALPPVQDEKSQPEPLALLYALVGYGMSEEAATALTTRLQQWQRDPSQTLTIESHITSPLPLYSPGNLILSPVFLSPAHFLQATGMTVTVTPGHR